MEKIKAKLSTFIGIIVIVVIFFVPFLNPLKSYLAIPDHFVTSEQSFTLPSLGSAVNVQSTNETIKVNGNHFTAFTPSEDTLIYNFSDLPIKKVAVDVLENIEVIPGGQSVGVQLQTLGVLVVGHHRIKRDDE